MVTMCRAERKRAARRESFRDAWDVIAPVLFVALAIAGYTILALWIGGGGK
jgi:hypothetical protein